MAIASFDCAWIGVRLREELPGRCTRMVDRSAIIFYTEHKTSSLNWTANMNRSVSHTYNAIVRSRVSIALFA